MSELPELYWSPSQGLVYRSGGAVSETWSVDPRDAEPAYSFTGDEIPADAVRLVAGRAAAELPVIPGGFKLHRDRIAFISYKDSWHLIGPAVMLPVGHLVLVERFSEPDDQEVLVGTHVAERTVRHADGETVTYAIAEIDKGDNR